MCSCRSPWKLGRVLPYVRGFFQRVFSRSKPLSSDNFRHCIDGGDPQEPLIVTRTWAEVGKMWPGEGDTAPSSCSAWREGWAGWTLQAPSNLWFCKDGGGTGNGKVCVGKVEYYFWWGFGFFFACFLCNTKTSDKKHEFFLLSFTQWWEPSTAPKPIFMFHHTGIVETPHITPKEAQSQKA